MWLSRSMGRGVHAPHKLFRLCQEPRDLRSSGEFEPRGQFLNLRSDAQVRFVDWTHLLQSFQEVAPVGALPDGGLNLPLKEFLFARLFDERAFSPDISLLLTHEKQKLGKILSPLRQVFGIKLGEFDLKVRRGDGLRSPPWEACVTCTTSEG